MAKEKKSLEELLEEALVPVEEQPYEVCGNWVWVRLGAINFHKSKNVNPMDNPDEDYELYSVPSYDYFAPEIVKGVEVKSNKQEVKKDEVLLCKINPRINRVWNVGDYTNHIKIASSEWIVIYTNSMIDNIFLMWALRSNYFRQLIISNVSGVGGSLTRARPDDVKDYPIPLPPLPEQQRIVNRIESLFSKLDKAKELIVEAREGFEKRKAAILAKAFRGELTQKWRKERLNLDYIHSIPHMVRRVGGKKFEGEQDIELRHQIPVSWRLIKYKHLFSFIGGGTPSKNVVEYWNGDINWASVKDIKGVTLNSTLDKISLEGLRNSSANLANPGDIILITRISPGKQIITNIVTAVNQDLKIVKFNVELDSKYVYYYFLTKEKECIENSSGTTVKGINLDTLNEMLFILPPLQEQTEIVRILDKLLEEESKIHDLTQLEDQIDLLKKSILSKAFRGQLNTNDPAEESAMELLKEILKEK